MKRELQHKLLEEKYKDDKYFSRYDDSRFCYGGKSGEPLKRNFIKNGEKVSALDFFLPNEKMDMIFKCQSLFVQKHISFATVLEYYSVLYDMELPDFSAVI